MTAILRPVSNSEQTIRERTYALVSGRSDYQDVIAQVMIVIDQLHREKYTGNLTMNFSNGGVTHTKLTEKVR